MTLLDLVEEYVAIRAPGWLVLDAAETMQQALDATRFYAAYGPILSIQADELKPAKTILAVAPTTALTLSEWGVIAPLFRLYVERENAMRLEASRGSGLDPYGRTVSEIAGDIAAAEQAIEQRAFRNPVRILGFNGTDELPPRNFYNRGPAGLSGLIPLLPADGA